MQQKQLYYYQKYLGLTLIEMILSLTLSALLLSAVMMIFFLNEKRENWVNEFRATHQSILSCIEDLRYTLHRSGYLGCAKESVQFPINNLNLLNDDFSHRIEGREHEFNLFYHDNLSLLVAVKNPTLISVNADYHKDDFIIISDCKKAEIAKIVNVSTAHHLRQLSLETPIKEQFLPGSRVAKVMKIQYKFDLVHKTIVKKNLLTHHTVGFRHIHHFLILYWVRENNQYKITHFFNTKLNSTLIGMEFLIENQSRVLTKKQHVFIGLP